MTDETTETDATLIARIAGGERGALDPLVRRHWACLFRYARRVSGDATVAEDALQDAFLGVLEHAGTFRAEGSARAWLFALTRNALRRRYRRRVNEPTHHDSLEDLDTLGAHAGFGTELGFLAALEDRDSILRALALLSDDDRETIALIDAEGLSIEEGAAALGLSVAAVKSRLHRARLRFMAAMRDDEGSRGEQRGRAP